MPMTKELEEDTSYESSAAKALQELTEERESPDSSYPSKSKIVTPEEEVVIVDQIMTNYMPNPLDILSKLDKDLNIEKIPKGEERYRDVFINGKIRHFVVIEMLPKFNEIVGYLYGHDKMNNIFSPFNGLRASFVDEATRRIRRTYDQMTAPLGPLEKDPQKSFPGLSHVPLSTKSSKDKIPLSASMKLDKDTVETLFVDRLPGGLADGKTPSDYDFDQIQKGIDIELEHTDDPMLALEIALDHLEENPEYYDYLIEMEEKFEAHASLKDLVFS